MDRTPPTVTTSLGALRGAWDDELAVFRGIPYAEPPAGALHLQAPVPVRRWRTRRDGVRAAATAVRPVGLGNGRRPQLADAHRPDARPGRGRLFVSINQQLDAGPRAGLSALAPSSIVDGYRRAWPYSAPDRLYETLYSDVLVRMPAVHLAGAHASSGGPTRLLGTNGPEVVPYPEQRSRALWPVDDPGPFRPGA